MRANARPEHGRPETGAPSRGPPAPRSRPQQQLMALQRAAGNRAVGTVVARAAPRNLAVPVQRRGPDVADAETEQDPKVDEVDAFLAARIRLYVCLVTGDQYTVVLDRTKNPWSERYTPRALSAAAIAALVHHMTKKPPPIAAIEEARDSLLDEQRYTMDAPEALGPAAVDPIYITRVARSGLSAIIDRLGLDYSEAGEALQRDAQLGASLSEALVEVARRFGSVRPHLASHAGLAEAELSPDHVFVMLTESGPRQGAAQLAKTHPATRALVQADDPGWATLTADEWGDALAAIALKIADAAGKAALERRERQRRHQLNEQLRPHQLKVAPADSARFILETYDPQSQVTVDFLGPTTLEAGQTITNAQGQQLFILRAGSQVIYQNLADGNFYRQAASGVREELVYGVFALVAEKTKYIIPAIQFGMAVITAVFPPARIPYLATNVLHIGSNVARNYDELLRLTQNLAISFRAVEAHLPGLVFDVVKSTASEGLSELFNPKYTTAGAEQVLLLALRVGSAAVRGAAGAGGAVLKSAWKEIAKELRSIGGILAQAKVLVVRQLSDPDSWEQHPAEQIGKALKELAVKDHMRYARLLAALSAAELKLLELETSELERNGRALVDRIADCVAW